MPHVYFPLLQNPGVTAAIYLRTSTDPGTLGDAIRGEVQSVDPGIPVFAVRTLNEVVAKSLADRRFALTILAVFAGVALLLASIGIYGVMAYAFSQRTHEIGVRVALGAQRADILRMALGEGMLLVAIGLGVGLIGAAIVTRFLRSMLFSVTATDPLTFASIALLLAAVALFACFIPAQRATQVDPLVALREVKIPNTRFSRAKNRPGRIWIPRRASSTTSFPLTSQLRSCTFDSRAHNSAKIAPRRHSMSFPKTGQIWHNGKMIEWDDAKVHVLSHVITYGSTVFEGIRCYNTQQGPAIFRLREHTQRLLNSARIYRMDIPFTADELAQADLDVVRANKMNACYIRPMVMRGYGTAGVNPVGCPIEVYITCWEWAQYLGEEALHAGVDVCVSSWNRPAPNTLPQMAKAAANYMNSQLIRIEAHANGYSEGIALDVHGQVSEGSGENIFLLFGGTLVTPPLSNGALPGITRNTVMQICRDLDIPVAEQIIPREMLYIADELFFCGTAVEVTPIRSVDRVTVGNGTRGPITRSGRTNSSRSPAARRQIATVGSPR